MTLDKLTVDMLISLGGALIALIGFYVPVFKTWLSTLGDWTPLFMAGVLLGLDALYLFAWCAFATACVMLNWQEFLLIWVGALLANQGAYKFLIKPQKTAK
ncbi:conserved membrane hypothetical protein [Gammaproteobacteria bacterium]